MKSSGHILVAGYLNTTVAKETLGNIRLSYKTKDLEEIKLMKIS